MTRVHRGLGSLALALTMALALVSVTVAPVAAGEVTTARVYSAEKYALRLLNCTRTGGFVRADGTCIGYGSGKYSAYRRPLRLHGGISSKVAWPWARAMAVTGICGHDIAGKPSLAQRMRNAGYRYPYYGENLGCGSGWTASTLVLETHRLMQAEKAARGGHWKNIKNAGYRSVGISVATAYGRTMVVYDFYGKRY